MRILLFILFASFIFSCKDKTKTPKLDNSTAISSTAISSTAISFYPVFELSPKTTAFVVNFSENDKKGLLDKLFDQVSHSDSIIYDTSGVYRLMKSDKLETEIKKYFNKEFYIYGTRGHAKTTIKDIVFGLDECRTNIFAFCIDKTSIRSVGHPIFCSDKLIDLTYENDYSNIEREIENYLSKTPADYSDSIKVKVLGNAGNFYFTYNDDFLWGQKPDDAKCKFPTRSIYRMDENNNISRFWAEDLDLFGIPCD